MCCLCKAKLLSFFGCSGCSLDLLICRWLRTLVSTMVSTLLIKFFGSCNYPKNFINKVLTSVRNQRQINKSNEQPEQPKTTITLPYINTKPNTHVNLKRHGTVQTVIRLEVTIARKVLP